MLCVPLPNAGRTICSSATIGHMQRISDRGNAGQPASEDRRCAGVARQAAFEVHGFFPLTSTDFLKENQPIMEHRFGHVNVGKHLEDSIDRLPCLLCSYAACLQSVASKLFHTEAASQFNLLQAAHAARVLRTGLRAVVQRRKWRPPRLHLPSQTFFWLRSFFDHHCMISITQAPHG
jgi:hypothetical protein